MKCNFIMAFLLFFIVFFRLSILSPYLYLAFIPAFFGIFYFARDNLLSIQNRTLILPRNYGLLLFVFIVITLFCIIFDLFQKDKNFQSFFTVRVLMLFLFSFIPAYLLVKHFLKNSTDAMEKIIVISLWTQVAIFFIMYMVPGAKSGLYIFFGMEDSVNLWEQNLNTRGFGLSGEINFMTPFLMVYISFFLIKRRYILIAAICLTQIINSNMAALAVIIGMAFSKLNINIKIATVFIMSILIYSLGAVFFPRFYDEFIVSGGVRTIDILLQRHVFTVAPLDPFSILFGFQNNISSSISDLTLSSDIGWVILFNYGGVLFIVLFLLLISSLSIATFGFTYLALLWFFVGVIFNTKGLALGGNSYFFISFIYMFLNRANNSVEICHQSSVQEPYLQSSQKVKG